MAKIRTVLTAAGFDEAMTLSVVDERSARAMQPWTEAEPLRSLMPVIRGADHLRTSLVPSLLAARRTNESLANPEIELFEIAKIYLPAGSVGNGLRAVPDSAERHGVRSLPEEWWMLGLTSGRPFAEVRGVVEAIVAAWSPNWSLSPKRPTCRSWTGWRPCNGRLAASCWAIAGQLSAEGVKQGDLRGLCIVAELRLAPLLEHAELIPQYAPLPAFPAVSRDLNLVVNESVLWAQIAATVPQSRRRRVGSRRISRHLSRRPAHWRRQEESALQHFPARRLRNAHQSAGRRHPRPNRGRLPRRIRR